MLRLVSHSFRAFLVSSAFFFFWAGGVLLAWTFCPVLMLVMREGAERRRVAQRVVSAAFVLFHEYMRVLGLLDKGVIGGDETRPDGPFVMIANHPTLVDVTAILSTYDDLVCVVRASLFESIFVGRVVRTCGHINGGNGEAMSGAAVMQMGEERLREGFGVLIFPEGTRSPPGDMHRFRRGAFELAARASVPLVPMFMTCTPPTLSKGLPIWRQPKELARLRMRPLTARRLSSRATVREECKTVEETFRERVVAAAASPPIDAQIARATSESPQSA